MRLLPLLLALAACAPSVPPADDDDGTASQDDDDATPVDIACDDPTLEPIIKALGSWPRVAACTTARLSVGTQDQQTAISLFWLIQDPIVEGATWALYFDGAEPADAVQGTDGLLRGSELMDNECSANPTANPVTNEAWSFTAGVARVTVTGTGTGAGWQGRVEISDAVVTRSASTDTCHLPDSAWDASFGLPPS